MQILFRHGARTPIWPKHFIRKFSNITPAVWDVNTLGKQFSHGLEYTPVLLDDGRSPKGGTYDDEVPTEMEGGMWTGTLTYLGQVSALFTSISALIFAPLGQNLIFRLLSISRV